MMLFQFSRQKKLTDSPSRTTENADIAVYPPTNQNAALSARVELDETIVTRSCVTFATVTFGNSGCRTSSTGGTEIELNAAVPASAPLMSNSSARLVRDRSINQGAELSSRQMEYATLRYGRPEPEILVTNDDVHGTPF